MKKREDIVNWYEENENMYKALAKKVKTLIEDLLEMEDIMCNSVSYRKKDKKSYCDKAMKDKYDNPIEQIKDLAGVRVIAYFNSDVKRICEVIEKEFDINTENSVNKTEMLGTDKVGYMSVHYIAKLKKARYDLPEYGRFKDLEFEIQIRTLLQHAWAEIEHDRNYKFTGVLPKQTQRKFSLVAGMLEMADMQFESIANEIDLYAIEVSKNTKEGELTGISIDSTSIKEYMLNRFKNEVENKLLVPSFSFADSDDGGEDPIDELRKFNVSTLEELDNMLNAKIKYKISYTNYSGLLRDYMMCIDAKRYFSDCWNNNWVGITESDLKMVKQNQPDFENIIHGYDIDIIPDDYEL